MRGTEDLVLVLLQGLDPGTDVRGVIRGIVGNSDFRSNEDARQFGAKFFFRVVQIAESVGFVQVGRFSREAWPVQCASS